MTICLHEPRGIVVVQPHDVTLLRSAYKLVEVWTREGLQGTSAGWTVAKALRRFPGDWVHLRFGCAARLSALEIVELITAESHYATAIVRVDGVQEPIRVAKRRWPALRAALGMH